MEEDLDPELREQLQEQAINMAFESFFGDFMNGESEETAPVDDEYELDQDRTSCDFDERARHHDLSGASYPSPPDVDIHAFTVIEQREGRASTLSHDAHARVAARSPDSRWEATHPQMVAYEENALSWQPPSNRNRSLPSTRTSGRSSTEHIGQRKRRLQLQMEEDVDCEAEQRRSLASGNGGHRRTHARATQQRVHRATSRLASSQSSFAYAKTDLPPSVPDSRPAHAPASSGSQPHPSDSIKEESPELDHSAVRPTSPLPEVANVEAQQSEVTAPPTKNTPWVLSKHLLHPWAKVKEEPIAENGPSPSSSRSSVRSGSVTSDAQPAAPEVPPQARDGVTVAPVRYRSVTMRFECDRKPAFPETHTIFVATLKDLGSPSSTRQATDLVNRISRVDGPDDEGDVDLGLISGAVEWMPTSYSAARLRRTQAQSFEEGKRLDLRGLWVRRVHQCRTQAASLRCAPVEPDQRRPLRLPAFLPRSLRPAQANSTASAPDLFRPP